MAKPENNEVWDSIFEGLPYTPSHPDHIPVPEILNTIRFCLKDGVELYEPAVKLADLLGKVRKDVAFLNWKAMVEYDAKKYIKSFETTEEILKHVKNSGTYFNAGRAAYKANKLEKSELYLRKAMEIEPDNSSFILDYSVTICTMGEFDKAFDMINSIDTSKLDDRHSKVVDFNKGWHYIRDGDFKRGIDLLHIGREINIWGSHANKYDRPQWDGSTEKGKTILIVGEGGIGDEVINARFSKIIKERGMNAVMSSVHNNMDMLSSISTLDKVFNAKDINQEKWDYWAPCMDLPFLLKIDDDKIPSEPYLKVDQIYVNKWKPRTESDKKLKVGIRWMGNPRYELELARTIPPELFENLAHNDIQLFSFQKNDGQEGMQIPHGAIQLADDFENWQDTMGAMMNMDLIITSCTSVAHVAAALGKPTWIVVPLLPYYTWANMKKESCWYDSVTLYRQKYWKDWSHPFKEVEEDLIKLLEKK